MKLGRPTNEIPQSTKLTRGKYREIYEALPKLKPNEWLPVEFDSEHDAYNFRVATTTKRNLSIEARLRGSSVYVRLRPAKNGSKAKGKR